MIQFVIDPSESTIGIALNEIKNRLAIKPITNFLDIVFTPFIKQNKKSLHFSSTFIRLILSQKIHNLFINDLLNIHKKI